LTRFGHQASAHGYRENRSQISGKSPDWHVTFAGAQKWSIQNASDDDWPFSTKSAPERSDNLKSIVVTAIMK
jgi:hypothetical protein